MGRDGMWRQIHAGVKAGLTLSHDTQTGLWLTDRGFMSHKEKAAGLAHTLGVIKQGPGGGYDVPGPAPEL